MLEQALCLLHSANYQISVLRRKRVLAAINKAKVNLGDLPLPNAKRMLFGDDFPSLASKQADLSRVLSKTLYPTFWIWASPQEELLYLWVFYLFKRLGVRVRVRTLFLSSKDGPTRINQHLPQWEQITSDPELLSFVKGFFHLTSVQSCPPITRACFSETQLIDAEVQELLKKGAI